MRRIGSLIFLLGSLIAGTGLAMGQGMAPVNPHATPEARALLAYLNTIGGKGIVTGQHNYPNDGARWTDLVVDLVGKYPGLYGEDFGFSASGDKDSYLSRPDMVAEVERQYKNGSLIALCWHEVRPIDDEPVTFSASVQGRLTDYEFRELLTPGTALNNRWREQVDQVAGFLKQLRDAHVPVLFRPYHEMNGSWFWWGNRPGKGGSEAVYRMLYDRLVNVHHLDNLVWVWNVNAPGGNAGVVDGYYPGADVVDVVSMDIYGEFKQEYYEQMLKLAAGKPIALAEVGAAPTPEVLEKQPKWTFFMTWSGFLDERNAAVTAKTYNAARAINRDDKRLSEPMAAIRKATSERTGGKQEAAPATPNATAETVALLAKLQETGAAARSGDAVFSGELSGNAAERAAVVKAATDAAASKKVVRLTWRGPRPNDASNIASGALTEWEWSELLSPGSLLYNDWAARVDEVGAALKQLEQAGVAVVFDPYPLANTKQYWYGGRKGIHGSAALYRQLFDRLTNHDGVRNVVWAWQGMGPESRWSVDPSTQTDYFPGLLFVDVVETTVYRLEPGFGLAGVLQPIAVGKPMGVEVTGEAVTAELLKDQRGVSYVAGKSK